MPINCGIFLNHTTFVISKYGILKSISGPSGQNLCASHNGHGGDFGGLRMYIHLGVINNKRFCHAVPSKYISPHEIAVILSTILS